MTCRFHSNSQVVCLFLHNIIVSVQERFVDSFISILSLVSCPSPIRWVWQHQATSNTSPPCASVLWVDARQATFLTPFLTHLDHVFLSLSRLLCPEWTWHVVQVQAVWATDYEGLPSYPQCQVYGIVKLRVFHLGLGATLPAYHGTVNATEPLQIRGIWFATYCHHVAMTIDFTFSALATKRWLNFRGLFISSRIGNFTFLLPNWLNGIV